MLQVGAYSAAVGACQPNAPSQGVKAMMSALLGLAPGSKNLGLYVCKLIAGSNQTSLHGVWGAGDWGTSTGKPTAISLLIVEQMRLFSHELGIQGLIHNRRAWWSNYGSEWLAYSGSNPHLDHVHFELTLAARHSLTAATVVDNLTGPAHNPYRAHRTVRQGVSHVYASDVAFVQHRLRAHGFTLATDGDFGPITTASVRSFQRALRLSVDGIVGPQTYGRLGV